MSDAPVLIPELDDLPAGARWLSMDDGVAADGVGGGEIAELFDCVGPAFPEDRVVATSASPHFVAEPQMLIHGFAIRFADVGAADQACSILGEARFAECLATAIAADFDRGPIDAQLLGADVTSTVCGHRVSFTGGDARGLRPVHLDIGLVQVGDSLGVLWCGNTPEPFPPEAVRGVLDRIAARANA